MGYYVTLHEAGPDRSVDWPGDLKVGMEISAYGLKWTVFDVDPQLGTAQARVVERRRTPRPESPSLTIPPREKPPQ